MPRLRSVRIGHRNVVYQGNSLRWSYILGGILSSNFLSDDTKVDDGAQDRQVLLHARAFGRDSDVCSSYLGLLLSDCRLGRVVLLSYIRSMIGPRNYDMRLW
jgi:hypothetical protein